MRTVEELNRMSVEELEKYCEENGVSVEIINGVVTGVISNEQSDFRFYTVEMVMKEDFKKYDAMIKACSVSKEKLIETGQMKGLVGVYNLGLENMYDYLIKNAEVRKHGSWFLLDECANAGVYCSVCHKKVYKTDYANQKIKSKYCPNCGAVMDLDGKSEFE